ncbi:MAG: Rha family transcriptional regulator [Sphingobium sp.]|nr:Rha family transcriptional regulator [Sphingobium sp.]
MNALVHVRDEGVRASSLDVAKSFDKRHDHVMRTVRELLNRRPDLAPNFGVMIQQVAMGKGAKRASHYYEMDRKGFVLLAMGFTGAKALEWKIAYIDAFDRMEAALSAVNDDDAPHMQGAAEDALTFKDRMKLEPPMVQLAYVREMRLAMGRPGAIRVIRELGWDDDEAAFDMGRLMAAGDPATRQVADWIAERCERAPGQSTSTTVLHQDFRRWCIDRGQDAGGIGKFANALKALGFPGHKASISYRVGLRLID